MSEVSEKQQLIQKLHNQACKENKEFYLDPDTGRMVFTSVYHLNKGGCCQSGCRHCPYGFKQ